MRRQLIHSFPWPAAVVLALLAGTRVAFAQAPDPNARLAAVSVTFHTLDHDKDANTKVSVSLSRSGTEVARVSDIEGHFAKDSKDGPFAVDVERPVKASELPGLIATVDIVPKGNEHWTFDYTLRLKFTDGSTIARNYSNITLTKDILKHVDSVQPAS